MAVEGDRRRTRAGRLEAREETVDEGPVVGAARAGVGAWLGFVVGTLAKLGLAFSMLGVFVLGWLMP